MSDYIYALLCPEGKIRYIGKSIDPEERLREHIRTAKSGAQHHCANWIRKLLKADLQPSVRVIEEVQEGASWQEAEIRQIALHLAQGHRLTNATLGGEGATITCPIIREKCRQASIRAHALPQVKAKDQANSRANWAKAEYREKHARAMAQAFLRPEVKASKSAAAIKKWQDPEYKTALSEKHKLINSDPEYVRDRIAKAAVSNALPEVRAKRSASAKVANSRPDVLEKNRLKQEALWKDPEYRRTQSEARKASWAKRVAEGKSYSPSEETKAKSSEISKKLWQDEDFVAKVKAAEPGRISAIKASWTPEKRAASAARMKARRPKMQAAFARPEVQEKRAIKIREKWLEENKHLSPKELACKLRRMDAKKAKRVAEKAAILAPATPTPYTESS